MSLDLSAKFTINSPMNQGVRCVQKFGDLVMPYIASSTKDEMLACRETAWLGVSLNQTPVYDIKGPDAAKLLNKVCVNRDYTKLKMGGSRHALMCNSKGQLLADGLIIRTGEEEYRTYWLAPVLDYYVRSQGMDVNGAYVQDEYFYQIDGPKSLEIMEAVCQCDLHDVKFAGKKVVQVKGTEMTIVRLGMSGCLGYEVHGAIEHADMIFETIRETGQAFGLKCLGNKNYTFNHTQGGYPNQFIHYWYPFFTTDTGMAKFFKNMPIYNDKFFVGSGNDDEENYFVTPYDIGWDYLINWEHDFIGKEALEAIGKNPPNTVVTLEWNADDVGDVFASQFRGTAEEPYEAIDEAGDTVDLPRFVVSKVLLDGKMVGRASGRIHDYYHRKEISLAFINKELVVEGQELVVLWGTNGGPQKEIRATVARFPYYNEEMRNETFDVEKIPHPKF